MTTIGILLFDGAEELDFVGPWEVFTMATADLAESRVVPIAERPGPIRCAKGLRVIPDCDFAGAPDLDAILVPGGQGTRREAENSVLLDWLAKAASRCQWVTRVWTGSLLPAAGGPAPGR